MQSPSGKKGADHTRIQLAFWKLVQSPSEERGADHINNQHLREATRQAASRDNGEPRDTQVAILQGGCPPDGNPNRDPSEGAACPGPTDEYVLVLTRQRVFRDNGEPWDTQVAIQQGQSHPDCNPNRDPSEGAACPGPTDEHVLVLARLRGKEIILDTLTHGTGITCHGLSTPTPVIVPHIRHLMEAMDSIYIYTFGHFGLRLTILVPKNVNTGPLLRWDLETFMNDRIRNRGTPFCNFAYLSRPCVVIHIFHFLESWAQTSLATKFWEKFFPFFLPFGTMNPHVLGMPDLVVYSFHGTKPHKGESDMATTLAYEDLGVRDSTADDCSNDNQVGPPHASPHLMIPTPSLDRVRCFVGLWCMYFFMLASNAAHTGHTRSRIAHTKETHLGESMVSGDMLAPTGLSALSSPGDTDADIQPSSRGHEVEKTHPLPRESLAHEIWVTQKFSNQRPVLCCPLDVRF